MINHCQLLCDGTLVSVWHATIHFPRYNTYPDTVVTIRHTIRYDTRYDTLHNNKTRMLLLWNDLFSTKHARHLVSRSWTQKSVQLSLTSLVGSTHAFVVSTILNIMLNTARHGFVLSVCLENRRAKGLESRRVSTN